MHSVRLVLGNLEAAFRVSAVLYLVSAGVQAWFLIRFGDVSQAIQMGNPASMAMMDGSYVGAALLSTITTMIIGLWIAVAWHRFVLVGEQPDGWLPQWQGGRLLGYFGRSILIMLVAMIAALIIGIPLGMLMGFVGGPAMAWTIPVLIMLLVMSIFYRLCLILPAAALDKPIRLGAAWEATKDQTGTIVSLAIVTLAATLIMQIPSMLNSDPTSIINIVYSLVVGWFMMLIGVSVLTTFYGHFIEGREVD